MWLWTEHEESGGGTVHSRMRDSWHRMVGTPQGPRHPETSALPIAPPASRLVPFVTLVLPAPQRSGVGECQENRCGNTEDTLQQQGVTMDSSAPARRSYLLIQRRACLARLKKLPLALLTWLQCSPSSHFLFL